VTGVQRSRTGLRRPSRAPWIVGAIVVLVALGLAVRWWLRDPWPPPQAPRAEAPVEPAASPTPEPVPVPVADPITDPAQARPLLETLSDDSLYRRALAAAGDPLRRWVVVTDNLAEGVSPRKALPFLAPGKPFTVVRRGGEVLVAPESYARYDAFAAAVSSIDAARAAQAYRRLHGLLEAAYRALGYPDASLDAVTARALRRVAAAPLRDEEIRLRDEGGIYLYADERLEALGDVEKHLLRMGPRNGRAVQAKARELMEALGLPAAEPGR
jgi:hypothetical protein